jgi:YHS domain-containing protein
MKMFKMTLLIASLIMSVNAAALDPIYTTVFSNKAIKGYDTVAYFTKGKPVKGKGDYVTSYMGAQWLFFSQKNLDLFLSKPTKYAPQYGGYCAYAVSQNYTTSTQPELFTVYKGKLYLNYNKSVNQKLTTNKVSFIADANKNWPKIVGE